MKYIPLMLTLISILFNTSLAFSYQEDASWYYQEQIIQQQRLEIEALQDDEVGIQEDARWYHQQQREDEEN